MISNRLMGTYALLIGVILLLSFSSNQPTNGSGGYTGAPGDTFCTDCHSSQSSSIDGTVSISGIPVSVIPNTTYSLTVTSEIVSGSPVRAGFQVVALKPNITDGGTFNNNSAGTSIRPGGSKTYFGHNPAKMFNGATSVTWTTDWTAPATAGDVTFYGVSVFANGSGSGGDRVKFAQSVTTNVDAGTSPLSVSIISSADISCFGEADGTATAEAIGGVSPYNFDWDNGESNATALNLDAGIRTVTVTDDAGATANITVTIDEPNEIVVNIISENNVTCNGLNNGSATLNAFGGSGTITYDWPGGLTGPTQTGLAPNVYFVTITDAANCTEFAEVNIIEPSALAITLDAEELVSCNGANDGLLSVAVSGGTTNYAYLWTTGSTQNFIDDIGAGTYIVEITDDNGCIAEESYVVTEPNVLLANLSSTSESAAGANDGSATATPVGGTAPYAYLWSNNETSPTITGLSSGAYSVVITDANDCSITAMTNVQGGACNITVEIEIVSTPQCEDEESGSLALNIMDGNAPYSYAWSDMSTDEDLQNVLPGTYFVTVTDANDCVASNTVILGNMDTEAPVVMLQDVTVYLDPTGLATVNFAQINNGSSDNCAIDSVDFNLLNFSCNDVGETSLTVNIFDAAGNSSMGTSVVTVADTLAPVITCPSDLSFNICDTIFYEPISVQDNCNNDGGVLVSGIASGNLFPVGVTEISYLVTDQSGNTDMCSFTVTVDIDLELEATTENVSCAGANDGSVSLNVSGGTEPYITEITPDIYDVNAVPPGIYQVLITDASGCVSQDSFTITEPDALTLEDPIIVNESTAGANDGSINITVSGGTGQIFFLWTDDFGNTISSDEDLTGLAAGVYNLAIVDENDCCIEVFGLVVMGSVSSIDLDKENVLVNVFPNPANDFINLEMVIDADLIEIYNHEGKLVRTVLQANQKMTIVVEDLDPALYLIKIMTDERVVIKQFLKL